MLSMHVIWTRQETASFIDQSKYIFHFDFQFPKDPFKLKITFKSKKKYIIQKADKYGPFN